MAVCKSEMGGLNKYIAVGLFVSKQRYIRTLLENGEDPEGHYVYHPCFMSPEMCIEVVKRNYDFPFIWCLMSSNLAEASAMHFWKLSSLNGSKSKEFRMPAHGSRSSSLNNEKQCKRQKDFTSSCSPCHQGPKGKS